MDRLITLALSDCHIGQSPCAISDNVVDLLTHYAGRIDTLIIAGDLFDVWMGDDLASDFQHGLAQTIQAVGASRAYFLPGNRDFLLGSQFLHAAGLAPSSLLQHRGWHYSHGDEFCLDDAKYMAWRELSRSMEFQQEFLAKTAPERLAIARQARDASQKNGTHQNTAIADIRVGAADYPKWIHGHTHRPAIHYRSGQTRVVLGDWRPQGWVMAETESSMTLSKWHHGWTQHIRI